MRITHFSFSIFLIITSITIFIRSKLREREITSYATRSLHVLIANEESISNLRIEKIIDQMRSKNMRDLSTAVILFKLLEKADSTPVSNDVEVIKYIDYMTKEYKGHDMPFLDRL